MSYSWKCRRHLLQAIWLWLNLKKKLLDGQLHFGTILRFAFRFIGKKKNGMIVKCLHRDITKFDLLNRFLHNNFFYLLQIISMKFQNILNLTYTMLWLFDFNLFLYEPSKLLRDYHKRVLRFKINIRIPISIFLLKHLTCSGNTINQFQNWHVKIVL